MNYEQLVQWLQTVSNQYQQIIDLGKKIVELPEQSEVVDTSFLAVQNGNVTQKLELKKLIDTIILNNVNQLLFVGEITIDGTELTIPSGVQWKISAINYFSATDFVRDITLCETGKIRKDIVVGNSSNQLVYYAGVENDNIAIRPNIPINTVLVTEINVTDSGFDYAVSDLYVQKSETRQRNIIGSGEITIDLDFPETNFRIVSNEITTILGTLPTFNYRSRFMRDDKIISLYNASTTSKTIVHSNTSHCFRFPNQQDFVLQPRELLRLRQAGSNAFNWYEFDSVSRVSNGGSISTLQQTMENGRSYIQTVGDYDYALLFEEQIFEVLVNDNENSLSTALVLDPVNWTSLERASNVINQKVQLDDGGVRLTTVRVISNLGYENSLLVPIRNNVGNAHFSIPNDKPSGLYTIALTSDLDNKADLVGGLVPSSQLPPTVDEILEFANYTSFPSTGVSNFYYLDLATNKTYRWSGSQYVPINEGIALGETPSTAYRGDRGKVAYEHSQFTGNPHGTTTNQITEAGNKLFVSASEKSTWNAKQDNLTTFQTKQGFRFFEEFLSDVVNSGWGANNVGGSITQTITYPNRTNQQGVLSLSTGTSATAAPNIRLGLPGGGSFYLGNGVFTMERFVNVETLSNATNRFYSIIGATTNSVFENTNGIFFIYDEGGIGNYGVASPNWKCITRNGTSTVTTTSIPVTDGAWVKLTIVVNANATSVQFFIDNVLVATHTTNIPTLITPRVANLKTAGTAARVLFVDYCLDEQTYTTPRL